MARRTKEEAEQTRVDILNMALDTFCELGYSKTTFDEIAKRLGLTKGAIYWHFRNKSDLISAIIQDKFISMKKEVEKEIPVVNGLTELKQIFVLHAKQIEANTAYRKFLFFIIFQMEWSETLYNNAEGVIKEIQNFSLNQIIQALKAAQSGGEISKEIDIKKTSIIILSLWGGLLHNEIGYMQKNLKLPDLVEYGFELIINSLKTRG